MNESTRRRRALPALAAAAAVALGALLAAPALDIDGAFAHPGGMAGDGCHKHKAAGERHWHIDGSAERGGECVKRDGRTIKVQPPQAADSVEAENLRLLVEAQKGQLSSAIAEQAALESTIANLRIELEAERDKARKWWQRATRAEDSIEVANLERDRALAHARGANADAASALAEAEEARKVAEDAEARARGIGPRVDRRCRAAVEEIVHGDTGGWFGGDDVEVDSEGRAKLSRACLAP